jgi:hypothetical protein
MDRNTGLDLYSTDPNAFTPLTRANLREALPQLMGQLVRPIAFCTARAPPVKGGPAGRRAGAVAA